MRLTNPAMFELAAQRRCLAAIFPELGGIWSSSCRPGVVTSSEPVAWEASVYPNLVNDPAVTAQIQAAPLDDYRLEAAFLVTEASPINYYLAGATGFGINYTATGQIQLTNYGVGVTGSGTFYAFTPELNREYTAVLDRVGGTMHIILDGVTVRTASGTNADWSSGSITMNRRTGVLHTCRWTNLTTGSVIFDYPESPSVRQNLIFLYNQQTRNGCFEADISGTSGGYIASRLDLAGSTSNHTFLVDFEIPAAEQVGATETWHLAGQGATTGNAGQFSMFAYRSTTGLSYLYFRIATGTQVAQLSRDFSAYWGQRCVAAGVIDWTRERIGLYLNGVLMGEASTAALSEKRLGPIAGISALSRGLSSYQTAGISYPNSQKIYGIMAFDGAMNASEIRAISNLMRAS